MINVLLIGMVMLSVVMLYSTSYRLWWRTVRIAHRLEDVRATYFVIQSQLRQKQLPLRLKVLRRTLYCYMNRWVPLADDVNTVNIFYDQKNRQNSVRVNIDWQVTPDTSRTTHWAYAI